MKKKIISNKKKENSDSSDEDYRLMNKKAKGIETDNQEKSEIKKSLAYEEFAKKMMKEKGSNNY